MYIASAPDARLAFERELLNIVETSPHGSLEKAELVAKEASRKARMQGGLEPDDLYELGESLSYDVAACRSAGLASPGACAAIGASLDVLFVKRQKKRQTGQSETEISGGRPARAERLRTPGATERPWETYTNHLRSKERKAASAEEFCGEEAFKPTPDAAHLEPELEASLRSALEAALPRYMVPARFVAVPRLPMTGMAKWILKSVRSTACRWRKSVANL